MTGGDGAGRDVIRGDITGGDGATGDEASPLMGCIVTNTNSILSSLREIALLNSYQCCNYSGEWCKKWEVQRMEMRSNSSRQEKMQHVHLFSTGMTLVPLNPTPFFAPFPRFSSHSFVCCCKGVFQMKRSLAMMALIVVMALSALGALPAASAASASTVSSTQVIAYSVFSAPHAPAIACC